MARGIKPTPVLLPLPDAHAFLYQIEPGIPLFSLTRTHWRKRHGVPTVRVGRALYFPKAELEDWARAFARKKR
jgi:hypothetical protein